MLMRLTILKEDTWHQYRIKDIYAIIESLDYYKITFKDSNDETLEVDCIWFEIHPNNNKIVDI